MDRHKRHWKAGALALAAGAAICAGAAWALQGELETTHYEVPLPAGLEDLDGLTIAQISDVHSAGIQEELRSALEQAAPDLIVFTGDLVNRDAGITVLEDEAAQLWRNGEQVNLIGLLDLSFHPRGLEKAREELSDHVQDLLIHGALNVVLSHRPSLIEEYEASGADLVFSGHAHGGQFRLPFVGGLVAPNQGLFPKYDSGLYTEGNTNMIVSRGIGNSILPFRFNNRPEVILIELKATPN